MYISVTYSINNDIKLIEKELFYFSLQKLLSRFLESISSRIKEKISNRFNNLYIHLQGARVIVQSYDADQSLQTLEDLQKVKRYILLIKNKFEEINYFDYKEIKVITNLIYSAYNDLEIDLKKIAYKNKHIIPTSEDFINALAEKSKLAIELALSC